MTNEQKPQAAVDAAHSKPAKPQPSGAPSKPANPATSKPEDTFDGEGSPGLSIGGGGGHA